MKFGGKAGFHKGIFIYSNFLNYLLKKKKYYKLVIAFFLDNR